MRSKKGFTLVELLVAGTIVGILAVFVTIQLRNSAAETRWTHAKAKADALATAVHRAKVDHPSLSFTNSSMNSSSLTRCSYHPNMSEAVSPSSLIPCGYLENFGWSDTYFTYYVCDSGCGPNNAYVAMVKVNQTARMPAQYKNYKYYAHPSYEGADQRNSAGT